MQARLLPHPYLSLLLAAIWCIVTNSYGIGNIAFGLILGALLPIMTRPYWPDAPRNMRLVPLTGYVFLVLWDILVANVEVAWIVLTRPNDRMRSRWVVVPLELTTPEAITILAGTITLTPGTVSADLSATGHALLVHTLDTADPEETARQIKSRYERRLREVFR